MEWWRSEGVIVPDRVQEAAARIRPYVKETPLELSSPLSLISGSRVYLKLENLQHTGSFKVRGAMNKILSLTDAERGKGVVAASTGNHGAAVAYAARAVKARATVFVPEGASASKVEAIRRLGAVVQVHGTDSVHAETHARQYAGNHGLTFVSPYNDADVVAGQGTIGQELVRQIGQIDVVIASLGGGGLVSGIGGFLKVSGVPIKMIACSPVNSCVMVASIRAGRILDIESLPTLSDGTAGGIEKDTLTFEMCRNWIDEYVLVSEDEIRQAMRSFMETHAMRIEGAAGAAIAGFLQRREAFRGKNVVIVICGANISPATLKTIL